MVTRPDQAWARSSSCKPLETERRLENDCTYLSVCRRGWGGAHGGREEVRKPARTRGGPRCYKADSQRAWTAGRVTSISGVCVISVWCTYIEESLLGVVTRPDRAWARSSSCESLETKRRIENDWTYASVCRRGWEGVHGGRGEARRPARRRGRSKALQSG